jgi:hypothetical protein
MQLAEPRLRTPFQPRWVFRGDAAAWDALSAQLADDPTAPARWPIAPAGPDIAEGDQGVLWRGGQGGGIVASCTVVEAPEASIGSDGAPRVTIGLRIDRAHHEPIMPSALAHDAALRPLAFMDLLGDTERMLSSEQQIALTNLIAAHDVRAVNGTTSGTIGLTSATSDLDHDVTLRVPVRLVPVVQQLLNALGADEPASTPEDAHRRTAGGVGPRRSDPRPAVHSLPSTAPSEQHLSLAEAAAFAYGNAPFTVEQVAQVWETGNCTARSRVERLVDVGLVERAGTQRQEPDEDGRPARGRPPVLYRLTAPIPAVVRARTS